MFKKIKNKKDNKKVRYIDNKDILTSKKDNKKNSKKKKGKWTVEYLRADLREFLYLNKLEYVSDITDISVKKLQKFLNNKSNLNSLYRERLQAFLTIY